MCGIFFVCSDNPIDKYKYEIFKLNHRGPDFTKYIQFNIRNKYILLAHTHLNINGTPGSQPFDNKYLSLIVNGEIYNYKYLEYITDYISETGSDCEVILELYKKYTEFEKMLNGQFSFVILDKKEGKIIISRDQIGITSLYEGYNTNDNTYFVSSELKTFQKYANVVNVFKPGHKKTLSLSYNSLVLEKFSNFNKPSSFKFTDIRYLLTKSVLERINTNAECGFLLSGGLDSSLICAIASRFNKKIKTFSIGLKGSPDLKAAREVSDFLKTEHYEFNFTIQEGIKSIKDVIYHTESYDVTTIRASVPMFLLGKKIKQKFPNIKVLLSGEGSDELFGGYLYFKNAPSDEDFDKECKERVYNLHLSDCLRAHKTLLAHGLEVRTPFLDNLFVECALNIESSVKNHKNKIEKFILRKTFEGYLPYQLLFRQKDQLSDAVGYNWIDALIEHTNNVKIKTCSSPEAQFYKDIFDTLFENRLCDYTVKRWIPKWSNTEDPSGRAQSHHNTN